MLRFLELAPPLRLHLAEQSCGDTRSQPALAEAEAHGDHELAILTIVATWSNHSFLTERTPSVAPRRYGVGLINRSTVRRLPNRPLTPMNDPMTRSAGKRFDLWPCLTRITSSYRAGARCREPGPAT